MAKKHTGGCFCGALRYECEADPAIMVNCHCRHCQRASGTAFAAIAMVPKAATKVTGEARYFKTLADSGMEMERGFCPTCGSQVLLKLERRPTLIGIQAASFDDPSLFKPTLNIWTDSAQPWDHMDAAIEKRPRSMHASRSAK
jgi:hypothetical protein